MYLTRPELPTLHAARKHVAARGMSMILVISVMGGGGMFFGRLVGLLILQCPHSCLVGVQYVIEPVNSPCHGETYPNLPGGLRV